MAQTTDPDDVREVPPVSEHCLNPAGRLFLFLTHMNTAPPEDMLHAVARYAEVQPNDLPAVYAAAAGIAMLPAQVRESAAARPTTPGARAVGFELDRVDRAFAWGSVLQGTAEQFRGQYDNGTTRTLEHWSETLNQSQGAQPLEAPAGIDRVRLALDDLAEQLRSEDSLDPQARSALLRHVDGLRSGVDQFFIGGVDALLAELSRLYGEIALDQKLNDQVRRRPAVWDRIVQVATAVGAVATIVHAGVTLSADVPALLQLGAAATSVIAPALESARLSDEV